MVWSRPMAQLSPGNQCVPRWRKMMLPGITYCSVWAVISTVLLLPHYLCKVETQRQKEDGHLPPVFLAPNLFPGPSFALLTAPCAACDACRTEMRGASVFFMDSLAKASLRHISEFA